MIALKETKIFFYKRTLRNHRPATAPAFVRHAGKRARFTALHHVTK